MNKKIIFEPKDFLMPHIPEFFTKREDDLKRANEALQSNNIEKVYNICHKIRGIAAPYGMIQLGDLAKNAIELCQIGDKEAIYNVLKEMQQYLESAKDQIE